MRQVAAGHAPAFQRGRLGRAHQQPRNAALQPGGVRHPQGAQQGVQILHGRGVAGQHRGQQHGHRRAVGDAVVHGQRVGDGMAGRGLCVGEGQPRQRAAAGHRVVGRRHTGEQLVDAAHYGADGFQRQCAGDGVGVAGPVALHRVGHRIQRRGHRQPHRHASCQLRVHERSGRVVVMVFQRALCILFRVPDGSPAGHLAASADGVQRGLKGFVQLVHVLLVPHTAV